MPVDYHNSLPGVQTERTATARRLFLNGSDCSFLPNTNTINGSLSRDPGNTGDVDTLRCGMVMGKITSTGLYAPSILGVTTNAEAIGATTIEASAAVVTELVRRVGSSGTFKLTGPATAGGVVETQTVTYSAASGTDITCTALTKAFVAGSLIQPTDGSEEPLSFIAADFGVKVTDQDAVSTNVPFGLYPVAGTIESASIVNWPSDAALKNWIMERFPRFTFNHEH